MRGSLAEVWGQLSRLAAGMGVVALAACGGGGGDSTQTKPGTSAGSTPTTTTIPASSLSISGFSPTSGSVGSTVTVTGAGFSSVLAVRLGSVAAQFKAESDAKLTFTVPAGAQGSRIELAASGRTVLSSAEFGVRSAPQVARVSPTAVPPGGRITLTGSNLDRVTQVRVNEVVFRIATQGVTTLAADVPPNATSGPLSLVDGEGIARPQPMQITVIGPMTITSFAPASALVGELVTVNGSNLDRAVSVAFGGQKVALVDTHTGASQITVTVPEGATTGTIAVQGESGEQVVSATPLTVWPRITVDPNAVYSVTAAGETVAVPGSGLTEVSGVTVGGVAASIGAQSSTQLAFEVPAGTRCGEISLQSNSQPAVAAGTVYVGNACAASLVGVEFAQVLSQDASESRQRLVPGKETWVRAFVVSRVAATAAPTVRLTGYSGATVLGTLDMSGPAALQNTGGTLPDAMRYSEAASFNAELPASWVASGLSIKVEVDREEALGPAISREVTPNVGGGTHLDIVLVPIVAGGFAGKPPPSAAVLDELTRRFPFARDRINVSTRAAYKLTSTTSMIDTLDEWSNGLSELRQLRDLENPDKPNRYYFGFVLSLGFGVIGIGYVPGHAALGWDSASGWQSTMSHELGHNFSLPHAPCGSASGADTAYPYAKGALGPQPLVDSVPATLDVIAPTGGTDIMGYCSGEWFSDYNYRRMQTHLEAQPQANTVTGPSSEQMADMLLIAGSIGSSGVRLRPVQALRGAPSYRTGKYTLRLVTRDGRTIDSPFNADAVDHADSPERHFSLAVLNPGPVDRIEVWDGLSRLPAGGVAAKAQSNVHGAEPLAIDWSETGGELVVRWNTAAASHVSVTHVKDGKRTVLAMQGQGGLLRLDTGGLPAGGVFELSLSDGLNAELVTLAR